MMKTCSPGTSRFDENDSFAMGEYVTVKISTKTHLKSFANKMRMRRLVESDFGCAMEK